MAQAEQYFAAEPQSKDVRRKLHVTLRGNEADVEVSNGVFSGNRVDLGTSVLLRQAPEPPEEGTFLDLGCGWGPIALTLGFESPKADIWALDVNERALELLDFFGMADLAKAQAGSLPYGAQRRLEIVRALATNPSIVLLDEPAAGMNPSETAELMENIVKIRDTFQIAILLIEHDMNLVMGICEGICVLNYGKVIAKGSPAEIKANPQVIEAYLGRKDGK